MMDAGPEPILRSMLSRKRFQALYAYIISLSIHLTLIISLSLIVILGNGNGFPGLSLLITDSGDSLGEELTEFDLGSDAPTKSIEPPPSGLLATASKPIEIPNLSADKVSTSLIAVTNGDIAASASLFEQSNLAAMGGGLDGMSEGEASKGAPRPEGKGPGASFFGTYAEGQRFVFVIDSSKSMLDGIRWPTLRRELIRALQSLSPDQEFLVISFDSEPHPMFGKFPPDAKFLNPTTDNVEKVNRWVGSIIHGGNTYPASSIGMAIQLKPDAIFLLSDGEIRDSTINDLRSYNRQFDEAGDAKVLIPIHTVLLHSNMGFRALKTIADENDGVFTPVRVAKGIR
jgi:hypothetical protein